MNRLAVLLSVGSAMVLAAAASAQVVPFFTGVGTAFDPQIGIVNTGVVQDVQAVVSYDRKYVTLNMQPQNATLLALREFTFQQGAPLGVVGLPGPVAPAVQGARPQPKTWQPLETSPSEIKRQANSWVLERQGMFRVASAP
jgi:hypothetical protein